MLDLPTDIDEFRRAVRQFVQAELPDALRQRVRQGQQPERALQIEWHERLAAAGLLVPHWPTQWGGRGWDVARQMAFDEEMALNDAPELNSVTFDMIGPVLMRYGNPEQQARFLPAIASGRQWWCQGYSEPNAGSDLASLKTRAVRDGDTTSSTARRSGRRTRSTPIGFSCWHAPTPKRGRKRVSASC